MVQRKCIQMSQFTTPLRVELIDDYLFRTTDGFVYIVGSLSGSEKIEVQAGFETDFASIPRLLWSVLPPHGKYAKAAVLHDWMYANAYRDKAYADKIFHEAMVVLGVSTFKAKLMYNAVKIFGRGKYK